MLQVFGTTDAVRRNETATKGIRTPYLRSFYRRVPFIIIMSGKLR